MSNFIEKCIDGDALYDEIDDYIAEWHEGTSDLPLHEYLGMTRDEYKLWFANANILPLIITAHRNHMNVENFLHNNCEYPLAARSDRPQEVQQLLDWLRERNLI